MTKKTMLFLPAVIKKLKIAARLAIVLLLIGGIEASALTPDEFQQRRITGRELMHLVRAFRV